MSNSSTEVAIIGLGNTLRRDDGIGIHVLSLLEERLNPSIAQFLNFGIASFGLVNYLQNFKKILLVDAIEAGLEPATLKIFKLNEASYQAQEKKISSHELSLSDLFQLCRTLEISSDIRVAGIQVKDTSYGLEMTGELEKAKDHLASEIGRFIASWQ
jgi:hydrogenase maturation protease